jgi:hypothetical protein
MRQPMPSPRGTNIAQLFLPANPKGAYDQLPDDVAAELLTFLQGKLSEADFIEACRLGGLDAGITMDQRRRRHALDSAATKSFAERFPHASTIAVNR